MIAGMRTVVLALSLAGCGRVNFDATGDAGIVDPPLPDAATFTAPCDVATLVGTGDVATPFGVAAEANLYRATWLDSSKVVHVLGVERTGDAIAVNERTFGASAFLPQPAGADVELYRGRGCEKCTFTGYRGRSGVFELLVVDEEIRKLILRNADANELRQMARKQGMQTILEDGIAKVGKGVTTLSEIYRVTQEE